MNELSYDELKDLSWKEFNAPFPWESHFTSLPRRKEVILKLDLWRTFANQAINTPEVPQSLIDAVNGDAPLSSLIEAPEEDKQLKGFRSDFDDLLDLYKMDHNLYKFQMRSEDLLIEIINEYSDSLAVVGHYGITNKSARKLYDGINAKRDEVIAQHGQTPN